MIHKTLTLSMASALGVIALAGTAQAQTYSNPAVITIPDAGTTPYPSPITVLGVAPSGPGYDINVTFFGLSHTFPADLDILLTGPGGFSVMLMSDVRGATDAVGVTLTFSDGSPSLSAAPLVSGTFAPTNIGAVDPMDPPAPVGPYGTTLNTFVGDPNGTWNLWCVDDLGADVGSISGGWNIVFSPIPTPGALALLGLAGLVGSRRRRA